MEHSNLAILDDVLASLAYKSHKKTDYVTAVKEGKTLYQLDTDNSGNDDILISENDETRDDLLSMVLQFHDLEILPEDWSLEKIDL